MTENVVHVDRSQHGVALLTMQRASKRNALNIALLHQMRDAIERLEQQPTCRAVILRGDGPVFSAGLDLHEANHPEFAEESATSVRKLLATLQGSPLVTIGAAHGGAYAGGAGLLAACDLVVSSDDFQLGFPEVRRGLVAAMVWGVMSRKIRGSDLRELLLLAEPVSAARAQQMGLVHWTVPADQVLDYARDVARKVLLGGPEAIRETKRLLNETTRSVGPAFLQALHERVRHGAEAREGLAAFEQRREPNWRQTHD